MSIVLKEEIIDEIKARASIVDIVGRYVNIKRAGVNYKGLCPFHSENTPSFVVSEDKQIFTCFGCGATGDVIEFVKKIENIDFVDAIEKLAKDCGIELKGHTNSVSEKRKEQLYKLNREAALFFYNQFNKPQNPGIKYMRARGINDATLKRFGIGYADDSWDSLYKFFKSKGIDEKVLLDLGLLSFSKDKYFDKFRNRVMFPIINTRGKVIGFGGRAIDDQSLPKYLNSPESLIFQKKNNLYGLNLSRQEIQKLDAVILVEGYMDVISLYQQGVRNIAASLGTALTIQQAQMLKRYTENVIIAYDSDEAGKAASLRAMDILYESGCKVKILQMKGFKDPDEYIKANGKQAFIMLIQNAIPIIEYKLMLLKKGFNFNSTEDKVRYVQKAADILSKLRSEIELDAYIKKIAAETKISENAIKIEILGNNKDIHTRVPEKKAVTNAESKNIHNEFLEKNLIKLMLVRSDFIPKIKEYSDEFTSSAHKRIFELIQAMYKDDEEIDLIKLKDSLYEDGDMNILNAIIENVHFNGKEVQIFEDCINRIKIDRLKKRQDEIINILQILDEESDKEHIEKLTKELLYIQKNLGK